MNLGKIKRAEIINIVYNMNHNKGLLVNKFRLQIIWNI